MSFRNRPQGALGLPWRVAPCPRCTLERHACPPRNGGRHPSWVLSPDPCVAPRVGACCPSDAPGTSRSQPLTD
eukprot:3161421-Alexandrium_andersonii.AAC.1